MGNRQTAKAHPGSFYIWVQRTRERKQQGVFPICFLPNSTCPHNAISQFHPPVAVNLGTKMNYMSTPYILTVPRLPPPYFLASLANHHEMMGPESPDSRVFDCTAPCTALCLLLGVPPSSHPDQKWALVVMRHPYCCYTHCPNSYTYSRCSSNTRNTKATY
jgi:hypothetical protein